MTRLVAETFFGKPRSHAAEHAHENSPAMTIPLVLLAVCAVVVGFFGTPAWPWLQAKLLGEEAVHGHPIFEGAGLMLLSIVLVGAGLGLGWAIYGRRLRTRAEARDPLEVAAPAVFAALANRLGVDELYAATVGRLIAALAVLADWFDRFVWDGAVRALAAAAINAGFDATSETLRKTARVYSRAQNGDAHGYLLTLAAAFVLLVLALVMGGAR
jgi:NADH-quinone oxidoreductase subunit L